MLTWIEIDGAALRHNYQQFVQIAGPNGQARVAPVLKSNAYGHGLVETYQALAALNPPPPWLCVNYVSEATKLRELGFKGRLLIVGPAVVREFAAAAAIQADVVIGNDVLLDTWLREKPAFKIHVKFDTGMSRQGFQPEDAALVAAKLKGREADVAGVCTHFANVEDVTEHEYASLQLKRFDLAVVAFRQAGFKPLIHAASSASSLIMDESRFDLMRVGISLYGFWPSQATRLSYLQTYSKLVDLRPALSWRTEITTVKPVLAGQFIGYGCTYMAVRDMRIAVLPVGYFEGMPRLAADHASYVLIRGKRCPLVGRICMNMMMVDISHLPDAAVGDCVTLIGTDGKETSNKETLHASDVASWAQTIHYELVSRLHGEIPRRLV